MISGLVAYLSGDPKQKDDVLAAVVKVPALEAGQLFEHRLPVVIEAEDVQQSHDLTEWLRNLPGVDHVDVAFVHLE